MWVLHALFQVLTCTMGFAPIKWTCIAKSVYSYLRHFIDRTMMVDKQSQEKKGALSRNGRSQVSYKTLFSLLFDILRHYHFQVLARVRKSNRSLSPRSLSPLSFSILFHHHFGFRIRSLSSHSFSILFHFLILAGVPLSFHVCSIIICLGAKLVSLSFEILFHYHSWF